MWPFGRRNVATRLTGIEEATEVELLLTMLSPNVFTSPVTGTCGAILHMEVVERISATEAARRNVRRARGADYQSLGELVRGDVTTFRDEDGVELTLVARRLRFRFEPESRKRMPLAEMPPDLAPSMRSPQREGDEGDEPLAYHEHVVREGDKVRLQAFVEPARNAIALGYRSVPRVTFVTRDDLAPVFMAPAPPAPPAASRRRG
jgi:hypothetical protein